MRKCQTGAVRGMVCARGGIGCPLVHEGVAAFTNVQQATEYRAYCRSRLRVDASTTPGVTPGADDKGATA